MMELPGSKKRGTLPRSLIDVVKEEMKRVGMTEEDASDWIRQRQMLWCPLKEEDQDMVQDNVRVTVNHLKLSTS